MTCKHLISLLILAASALKICFLEGIAGVISKKRMSLNFSFIWPVIDCQIEGIGLEGKLAIKKAACAEFGKRKLQRRAANTRTLKEENRDRQPKLFTFVSVKDENGIGLKNAENAFIKTDFVRGWFV